jgi:hypothetical protein
MRTREWERLARRDHREGRHQIALPDCPLCPTQRQLFVSNLWGLGMAIACLIAGILIYRFFST